MYSYCTILFVSGVAGMDGWRSMALDDVDLTYLIYCLYTSSHFYITIGVGLNKFIISQGGGSSLGVCQDLIKIKAEKSRAAQLCSIVVSPPNILAFPSSSPCSLFLPPPPPHHHNFSLLLLLIISPSFFSVISPPPPSLCCSPTPPPPRCCIPPCFVIRIYHGIMPLLCGFLFSITGHSLGHWALYCMAHQCWDGW